VIAGSIRRIGGQRRSGATSRAVGLKPHSFVAERGRRLRVAKLVYRYTPDMPSDRTIKTAVSLPQRLFEATERAARRRGVPRSRIFVEALEHHLADEEESDVTAQINASLVQPMSEEEAEEEASAEAFVAEAARRLLPEWEWKGDRPR
jgi:hypothetical protein